MHLIAILLAAASPSLTKQELAAMAMTPEQIASIAGVEGTGPLDPDIWIETRTFLPKQGNDRWLRARIDKATGAAEYQMYFIIEAEGQAFRPQRLTFEGPSGLRIAKVHRISFEPTCYRSSGCWIKEHAVANISRSDLEHAAQGAQAGQDNNWPAKLFGESQGGADILTFKTEIAGLLLAVDSQLAALGKPKPPE